MYHKEKTLLMSLASHFIIHVGKHSPPLSITSRVASRTFNRGFGRFRIVTRSYDLVTGKLLPPMPCLTASDLESILDERPNGRPKRILRGRDNDRFRGTGRSGNNKKQAVSQSWMVTATVDSAVSGRLFHGTNFDVHL